MENYDPKMAARVWQRVHKTDLPTAGEVNLPELIAREWLDGQICLQLSKHRQGSGRAVLWQIAREKKAHADCLKGICNLMTGTTPRIPRPPIPKESASQLLRSCCDGTGHCISQYEALCGDPRHGKLYAALAEQSRQQHYRLLALLGKQDDSKSPAVR